MFLAYQLDKQIRGSRFYQSIFYIPVVIAPAIIGLISELILSPQQGLISSLFADPRHGHVIDWLGNPSRSLWAVLVLACWRHASYVMIIYLAGLKALDPTLREAAAIDGASGTRTYFRVVLPALKPINIVLVVITVIEALRAFDIVYIINRGRNGLELLSVLITGNIIGEASRIGYGSAIAVVLLTISLVPIVIFVWNSFQEVPSHDERGGRHGGGGGRHAGEPPAAAKAPGEAVADRPARVPDPDRPALGVADPLGDLHRDAALLGHVRARLRLLAESASTSRTSRPPTPSRGCRTTSGTRSSSLSRRSS